MGRLADRFGIVRAGPPRRGRCSALGYAAAGLSRDALAVRPRPRPADRPRQLRHVQPADGGHHATGSTAGAASRSRSARRATTSPGRSGRRSCSTSSSARAGARPISASACSASSTMLPLAARAARAAPPARQDARAGVAAARARRRAGLSPGALQALLIARGPLVLRRHVDAAGAYRGLLRRARLRRRARRRDAVADARLRHRQPASGRASSPTGSAASGRSSSARSCRASRCSSTSSSTGSRRST